MYMYLLKSADSLISPHTFSEPFLTNILKKCFIYIFIYAFLEKCLVYITESNNLPTLNTRCCKRFDRDIYILVKLKCSSL